MVEDPFGALVPGTDATAPGAATGPLAGCTFVAKDVFDLAGMPTGAGNPTRRSSTPAAVRHAAAVERLLAAGADLVGRSRTDELAYGLSGRNELDGSPENPAAPGRLTGGSSSGSASAVASGLTDIGLGTDTGGSIRVPASHCGLFGLRPTHGRVPVRGLVPLAPSFDAVGWLTATAALCARVGAVLLDPAPGPATPITGLLVLDDLVETVADDLGPAIGGLADRLGATSTRTRLGVGDDLDRWREAYRVLQGAEAWSTHGRWITETQPELGPPVRERFDAAARLTAEEVAGATAEQNRLRARVAELLAPGTALVVPAAAGPPLLVDADAGEVDATRRATLTITCLAPLAGLPASAQPIDVADGLPMGLSLVGSPGSDEALLAALVAFADDGPQGSDVIAR